ncbi:MAG: phosphopyruvate hydratase [Candidatus Diapherotrites archaeon]
MKRMAKISSLKARQVFDSRGFPTVEASLKTAKGVFSSMVPSGASTGTHEALELRDGGKEFGGKGVSKAVANVNGPISNAVTGKGFSSQKELDSALILLDGTKNKEKLGANAILAASMAFARAQAAEEGMQLYEFIGKISGNKNFLLPTPQMNVINGGKHAGNALNIQEHHIVPKAKSFADAMRLGTETYQTLKKLLLEKYGKNAVNVGDEGGFAPPLKKAIEPIELIQEAIEKAGYGKEISIALDCAASEFFGGKSYELDGKRLSPRELVEFYGKIVEDYGIVSIEDGLGEDDWQNWFELTKSLGSKIQIIGDDLLVTNVERIKKAVELKACNALLLKVNQIGTVSEAIDAANLAKKSGWKVIVSHRSGETEDSFIADLVVGLGCGQCKFGAPARGERTAKYNRLLRIEEERG